MAAETGHGDTTKGIFWDALRPSRSFCNTSNYE